MPDFPKLRVLVTRSLRQASELADRLRESGIEPVLLPAIELVAPSSFEAMDRALREWRTYDWLLFTSANAVEAMYRRAEEIGSGELERLASQQVKIAAVGKSTARALEARGLAPNLIPPQAVAESLAEALLPYAVSEGGRATRFLLIRAEEAREHLPETLRAAGAEVVIASAYRTVIPDTSKDVLRALFAKRSHWPAAVTFTSSSTVRNLLALCEAAGVALPAEIPRISIGPVTSATLQELDLPAHAEAKEATVASLAEAVADFLR